MALHGKIEVNGREIGRWCARRRELVAPAGRPNTYECWAFLVAEPSRIARFILEHEYADGAWALTARVMDEAARLLRPEVPERRAGAGAVPSS